MVARKPFRLPPTCVPAGATSAWCSRAICRAETGRAPFLGNVLVDRIGDLLELSFHTRSARTHYTHSFLFLFLSLSLSLSLSCLVLSHAACLSQNLRNTTWRCPAHAHMNTREQTTAGSAFSVLLQRRRIIVRPRTRKQRIPNCASSRDSSDENPAPERPVCEVTPHQNDANLMPIPWCSVTFCSRLGRKCEEEPWLDTRHRGRGRGGGGVLRR